MTILKHALLGSLRIAFFGALKTALFAYSLCLSDTALASSASEDDVQVGNKTSYAAPENKGGVDLAEAEPDAGAARAGA